MRATVSPLEQARPALSGWPIVGWATLIVLAIQAVIFALVGPGEDAVRMSIRASARTSVVLFGMAFAASSLLRLWPSAPSRWLMKNRRYLGVSFACSHAIHLAAILTLVFAFGKAVSMLSVGVGGFAYVLIAAMTATSFDRTAAWLGPRRWKALHGFGARFIWLVFFLTWLPAPGSGPIRIAFWLFVIALAALRTAAAWQGRRAPAVARARP